MTASYPRKTDTLSRIEMDLQDPHFGLSVVDAVGVRRFRVKEVEVESDRSTRVKTVLRFPQHGVEESYFQLAETIDGLAVQPLTQFRMRAVSKEGLVSKWNYSNLMTADGEHVIFQLLAEIADNLDWLNDQDLQFLLENFANDLYLERVLERKATPLQDHVFAAKIKMALREQLTQAVNALAEFREELKFNPQEIATIYKDYATSDRRNGHQKDFIEQVISSYLEDKLDLTFHEQISAYGEGESPFAYAEDVYDFILKGEFLQEEWSPFAKDHTFFVFKDMASLLSDPVVQEMMRLEKSDSFVQTFLFALTTMMGLSEDQLALELFQLVEDMYEQHPETPSILLEQEESKIQLLYEVLGLIFEQKEQLLEVNPELASRLMYRFRHKAQHVLLTRQEDENIPLQRVETIHQTKTRKNHIGEEYTAEMSETVQRQGKYIVHRGEQKVAAWQERLQQVVTGWTRRLEIFELHLDEVLEQERTLVPASREEWKMRRLDRVALKPGLQKAGKDTFILFLGERLRDQKSLHLKWKERMKQKRLEKRELLYRMGPSTRGTKLVQEKGTTQEVTHELTDKFVQGDFEFVQYALGEEYDNTSVGAKTVGEITL